MKKHSTVGTEIDRLHLAESREDLKDSSKIIHIDASIPASYDRPDSHLDALSRLMTGPRDVCTAICLDSTGKLLVANNSGDHRSFQQSAKLLSSFIQSPFKDNYDALEKDAWQKVRIIRTQDKINRRISGLDLGERAKFASPKGMMDILNNPNDYSKQAKILAAEILQPLIDTRRITAAIVTGKLNPEIVNALRNPRKNTSFVKGGRSVHAEMKIVDHLGKTGQLGKSNKYNIGLSKLCCCPCAATIRGVTEKYKDSFLTPGTHGGTYPGWRVPKQLESIALQELRKLKGGGHEKYPETTIDPAIWQSTPSRPALSEFRSLNALGNTMVRVGVLVENAKLELVAKQQQRREFLEVKKKAQPILRKLLSKLKAHDRLQSEQKWEERQLKEIDKKLRGLDSDIKKSTEALKEIDKTHEIEVNKLLNEFGKKSVSKFQYRSKLLYDKLVESKESKYTAHERKLERAQSEKKALELKSKLLKGHINTTKIQLYENFSDIESVNRKYRELTTDIKELDKSTTRELEAAEPLVKSAVSVDTDLKESNKALHALTGKAIDVQQVKEVVAKRQAIEKAKNMKANLSGSVSQRSGTSSIVISKKKLDEQKKPSTINH